MTRRGMAVAALLVLVSSTAACGKYGKPIRSRPTPPITSTQPGAAAPSSQPAQSGESCEDDAEKEKPTP